ncbi:MAG: citrate synthase/methylcitrate synthase [Rhizobiales bacterium 65-9]|nr:citrate synthase/methylcitrate synthase [Hyphomicrobiales bacterium]OJY34078.1 MAG: citrate synthase/methylcitrate synthase [Rhizobiales bacterium 65-9]
MPNNGMDDVVAAETVLSDVDGSAGRLILRGYSLDDLAGVARYEDMLSILLAGFFPDLPDEKRLPAALGATRRDVAALIRTDDAALPPIEAVRAMMARIPDGEDCETALKLIAAPAVFTAAVLRLRRGLAPLAPDESATHAADILRMIEGATPGPERVAALDAYLVTVSDHGLNASTFAARVVASTRAGLTSAVLAAISALKGPLHGGAPGPVLDALDSIGAPDRAEEWLESAVAQGERLMGFGHRVYRVRDPRADALKAALARLARSGGVDLSRVALAEAVERAALTLLKRKKPDRPLDTNVEFYTALLLEALNMPRDAFTCVFAMGRVGGWIAHAREQVLNGRLIRPKSRYIGPIPKEAA